VLFLVVLTACSIQEKSEDSVKIGDIVAVHYTGTLDDGTLFDTSEGKEALKFKVGSGEMIRGFDQAVIGMKVGEEKDITLQPSEAYGAWDPKRVSTQPRENVETNEELRAGMTLMAIAPDGGQMPVKVLNVSEDTVTVDLNHPLAGKILHFNIKVVGKE